MNARSNGVCACSRMSSAATSKPSSSMVPISASTATRAVADALGCGAAKKARGALALPLASTVYVYASPGTSPVMVAQKMEPVQPKPAVYVCVRAGAVAGLAGAEASAHVTEPWVSAVQPSSDTHATAISVGPPAVRARLSCCGPRAALANEVSAASAVTHRHRAARTGRVRGMASFGGVVRSAG